MMRLYSNGSSITSSSAQAEDPVSVEQAHGLSACADNDDRQNLRISKSGRIILLFMMCFLPTLVVTAAMRDPTQPLTWARSSGSPDSGLSAILLSPKRKVAVYNSSVVQEGDHIDGLIVIRIEKNKIIVEEDGKLRAIPLISKQIKQVVKKT